MRTAATWLAANQRTVEKLITHRLPLARFHEALAAVIERQALKAVLTAEPRPPTPEPFP